MAPGGPGAPGAPGGGGPGGPGGPRGGGRGGFGGFGGHGGRPGGGYAGWGGRPWGAPGRRPAHTPIGNNSSGGELLSDKIFNGIFNAKLDRQERKARYGKKATIMGLKLSTTVWGKEAALRSECKTQDDLFAMNRITAEQRDARKIEACRQFVQYEIAQGVINEDEFEEEMKDFAKAYGFSYTPSTGGRTL